MSMRVAAPLLSLLGHELRAPAGVVGGYLALLERGRDPLTPAQQQAVAGARRAQQAMVEALDDLHRLTAAWRADSEPLSWLALPQLVLDVRGVAAARGIPLTVRSTAAVAVPRRGDDSALAEALVAVAEAVTHEHGAATVAETVVDDGAIVWRMRPAGADPTATTSAQPFDQWRAGLGMRVVAAVVTIAASHGELVDLQVGGQRYGVDIRFDLRALSAAT